MTRERENQFTHWISHNKPLIFFDAQKDVLSRVLFLVSNYFIDVLWRIERNKDNLLLARMSLIIDFKGQRDNPTVRMLQRVIDISILVVMMYIKVYGRKAP